MKSYYNKTKNSYYFMINYDEIEKARKGELESKLVCAFTKNDCGTKISLKFDSLSKPDFYINLDGINFETSDKIDIFVKDKEDKDWKSTRNHNFSNEDGRVDIHFM